MNSEKEIKYYDFVVVGGGLAGLTTAYGLAQKGRVALISRASIDESNSYYAQGGMAVVTDPSDTPKDHYADTIEAGRGLCDPKAVKTLTEEAPHRIDELIAMGMHFDTENGHLALGLEGGHHHKRILHAGGDATGRMVTTFMIQKVLHHSNIEVWDHSIVYRLAVKDQHCCGVFLYDEEHHIIVRIGARSVVIASGGAAALYQPTTNPRTALGDGLALACEQGVTLADLEFVQFHPTALYLPDSSSFLVSEAVRGEGAILLNKEGKRFMQDKHPLQELAPRDLVARTIFQEIQKSGVPYVTLSLHHIDPDRIRKRFPTISQKCLELGFDLTKEIPVAPAAHYTVGGIQTDLYGRTSLAGLYAVGEVASTGVMGANRLASNSLVECLVFGHRIAQVAPIESPQTPCLFPTQWDNEDRTLVSLTSDAVRQWRDSEEPRLLRQLGECMMQNVGIIRTSDSIQRAVEEIRRQKEAIRPLVDLMVYARQTYHRYQIAEWIARSAAMRQESRGGHFREDFPQTLPTQQTYRTVLAHDNIHHIPLSL